MDNTVNNRKFNTKCPTATGTMRRMVSIENNLLWTLAPPFLSVMAADGFVNFALVIKAHHAAHTSNAAVYAGKVNSVKTNFISGGVWINPNAADNTTPNKYPHAMPTFINPSARVRSPPAAVLRPQHAIKTGSPPEAMPQMKRQK
eukprot:TRINITY_DN67255_c2_g1_i1.p2 TRINITY_DN67255_c2_g1~~TRINITY_DN67255_c2_g1_i1.p2  ORF type:complete len:145 (+),score=20.04 TRINITY_DN67255_c2_g1_i1:734-1168(+)